MRLIFYLFFLFFSMTTQAGEFFPTEYKQFQFQEGDMLVSKRSDGKFAVNKILKVDRFDLKKGTSISIQSKSSQQRTMTIFSLSALHTVNPNSSHLKRRVRQLMRALGRSRSGMLQTAR